MIDPSDAPADSTPLEAAAPASEDYLADISFQDLGLSEPLLRALTERGYLHPTPVQAKAFGPVLQGRDLIVRSKTGTGKTAAFGLPLLEKISSEDREVKALVLCPTRELAMQVGQEISDLGKYKGIQIAVIYGGASMKVQEDALKNGAAFVVGTPGRVYDHIRRGNLKLQSCRHAVLDEADEMLNQGFYEEVTRILDCLPKDRQVLLFSATVPPDIQNLISKYTKDPEALLLSGDVLTVDHIHHIRYDLSDDFSKPRNLVYVLEMEQPDNAIVFCNTREDTSLITAVLNRNGFDAEMLSGELAQKDRERVMAKVKRGELAFMVATDIAARGIDISDLGHVINYSLPEDPSVYLHRVGRTGRIGKKGVAINLVSGRELSTFTTLEKRFGITFERRQMPSADEALQLWTQRHVREIREASGGAVYEAFLALAGQIKTRPDADDLIAFLLKYFFSHHRMERAQALLASQGGGAAAPAPSKEPRRSEPSRPSAERPGRKESSRAGQLRGAKRERRPESSPSAGSMAVEPGQVRLWVNLGQADNLEESTVKAALEAAGAPAAKALSVDVKAAYSFVTVGDADVQAFEGLNGKSHGDKVIKVERAKPPIRRRR